MIDVSTIPPARLLAALYNNAKPLGMGFLHARPNMTEDDAAELLRGRERPYFDYLYGRPLKVEINGSTLNPRLYDRDWGDGAAERIVNKLL